MGDDCDPALIVDQGDRVGQRPEPWHACRQPDPEQVSLARRDLLADHELDGKALVARARHQGLGHVESVVLGQHRDLETAHAQGVVDRDRGLGVGPIAARVDVEVGPAERGLVRIRWMITDGPEPRATAVDGISSIGLGFNPDQIARN